jgi:hypothetical protein
MKLWRKIQNQEEKRRNQETRPEIDDHDTAYLARHKFSTWRKNALAMLYSKKKSQCYGFSKPPCSSLNKGSFFWFHRTAPPPAASPAFPPCSVKPTVQTDALRKNLVPGQAIPHVPPAILEKEAATPATPNHNPNNHLAHQSEDKKRRVRNSFRAGNAFRVPDRDGVPYAVD